MIGYSDGSVAVRLIFTTTSLPVWAGSSGEVSAIFEATVADGATNELPTLTLTVERLPAEELST